ncbi:MAG: hypothetical protein AAFY36_17185, partial [Bacteroidota bacterium]
SLDSEEALNDPFHPDVEGLTSEPFLTLPHLANTLTDTHFEQRDRQGRLLVMLARTSLWNNQPVRAIACNDATAVAIEPDGTARVFGEFPNFPDYAWFITSACTDEGFGPEILESGQPITWNNNGQALSGYRLAGNVNGSMSFNLPSWSPDGGGFWHYWSAVEGDMQYISPGNAPAMCGPSFTQLIDDDRHTLVYPNPAAGILNIQTPRPITSIRLLDELGRTALFEQLQQPFGRPFLSGTSAGRLQILENTNSSADPIGHASANIYTLNLQGIPPGFYTLEGLDSRSGEIIRNRIYIMRNY